MTEEKQQELRQLLDEAMVSLEILPFSGYNSLFRPRPLLLPVNLYRKHLQQRWTSYLRDFLLIQHRFHPDIINEDTKSKLLDFIREELDPFIEEDSIGSASYAIDGEPADGFGLYRLRYYHLDLRVFLEHLLKIAIARGVEEAVLIFDRFSCTEGTHGSFQSIASLEGIWLETEIQVCEGVRLAPFSRSTTPEIWGYLRNLSTYAFGQVEDPPIGKTLLIIDRPVFSIFHKPSQKPFQDEVRVDDVLFQFKLDGEKFPNSSAVDSFEKFFCQALSLACSSPVQIASSGWFLAEYEFFQPDNPTGGMGGKPGLFGASTKIGEAQIEEAKRLYDILVNLDPNVREKLQIPIDRWIQSKTLENLVDKIIDLGIAFEALYLSDIEPPRTELSFRLRFHASWYLGKDKEDRRALMNEFGEIYNWRSSIVHTGKLPNKKKKTPFTPKEVEKFIARAQDLCRQSIIKIMEDGQFPDRAYWNNLILGGEVENDVIAIGDNPGGLE